MLLISLSIAPSSVEAGRDKALLFVRHSLVADVVCKATGHAQPVAY